MRRISRHLLALSATVVLSLTAVAPALAAASQSDPTGSAPPGAADSAGLGAEAESLTAGGVRYRLLPGLAPGDETRALAVNNAGLIAGENWRRLSGGTIQLHAVAWRDGRVIRLDPGRLHPDGESYFIDLNGRGEILFGSGQAEVGTVVWRDGRLTVIRSLAAGAYANGADINDHGWVAGTYYHQPDGHGLVRSEAFLWRNGVITLLGTLGGTNSRGIALNNRGQVVGISDTADGQRRAFLWENGRLTDLGTLQGPQGEFSEPIEINNRGQVVGISKVGNVRGFVWENGRFIDIGSLEDHYAYSRPVDINEHGQVIGESMGSGSINHAFIWRDGHMTDLGSHIGAAAINDRGLVAGVTTDPTGGTAQAMVWWNGRTINLHPRHSTFSVAIALNDNGLVIGHTEEPGAGRRSLVWKLDRL